MVSATIPGDRPGTDSSDDGKSQDRAFMGFVYELFGSETGVEKAGVSKPASEVVCSLQFTVVL